MTDKYLKKLRRRELLELLLDSEEENRALATELQRTREQLEKREILIRESGSLAEASLKLSGIFAAADAAVRQYQDNIRQCNQHQQQIYDQIIAEAKQKASRIVWEAEQERKARIRDADLYWEDLREKLEEYSQAQKGVRELLSRRNDFILRGKNEKNT